MVSPDAWGTGAASIEILTESLLVQTPVFAVRMNTVLEVGVAIGFNLS